MNEEIKTSLGIYDYRFDEEISISSYYTPFRSEGLQAADNVLTSHHAPLFTKEQAKTNILYYVQNLQNTSFTPIKFEFPVLNKDLNLCYRPGNASILKTKEGYIVACRTTNYLQEKGLVFKMLDPEAEDFIFDSRNFLLKYDKDLTLQSQHEILDHNEVTTVSPKVKGLEDIRIFDYQGKLFGVATVFQDVSKIAIFQLAENASDKKVELKDLTILKGPAPNRFEKNWLPLVKDQSIHMIYSHDPMLIYGVKLGNENLEIEKAEKQPKDYTHFRGSARPIPFENGYLSLVHEVHLVRGRNHYLHRFLQLDRDCHIVKISNPFTYRHQGVEFCAGMTVDHLNKNLVMTVSIEDQESFFASTPLETVKKMLH